MTPQTPLPTTPPTASYRLQLQPEFTLRDATAAVPYLAALGVSHLHLSPLLEAAPGSAHGYDTVDHTRISEQLGGEQALRELAAVAHGHGLGLIADTVPNHMAVPVPERLNHPLWQVLRDGPESPFARWFDIDWAAQSGRVLLPVLGGPLGEVLDQFRVDSYDQVESVLHYHGHALPLRRGTEGMALPELIDRQWYRLAWWRLGRSELNYRRFFTVSDLIAVRVEDPEVFDATHAVLLRLRREGVLDGFRIDHPDGLADPRGYLQRLAEATDGAYVVVEKILTGEETLPTDWPCAGTTGYDALHRIDGVLTDPTGASALAARAAARGREELRDQPSTAPHPPAKDPLNPHPAPPAHAAPDNAGQEPPPQGRGELRDTAPHPPTHDPLSDFRAVAARARAQLVAPDGELAAELNRLTRLALRASEETVVARDQAPWAVRRALAAALVAFPVYRPYVVPGEPPDPEDLARITAATDAARAELASNPVTAPYTEAAALVRDLALGALGRGPARDEFVARFAQTAAAVAAKGVEDTAFYRWTPLLSANEVGGDPARPAVAPAEFHAFCARAQREHPYGMTALSTHDTKRSADARARLAVLAELPDRWSAELDSWSADAPDPGLAEQFWQTVIAAWPLDSSTDDADRVVDAVLKAAREAKLRTSWTERNGDYERAVEEYARASLDDPELTARVEDFVDSLAPYERANTLSATLLQLTVPGVPDLYQGSEEPLYTLVDPDNRRPVDLDALNHRLTALDRATGRGRARGTLAAEKLHLTALVLRLRRAQPEIFSGAYTPVHAEGPAAEHALAFLRGDPGAPAPHARAVLTVATRLPHGLERTGGWRGTELDLPPGPWTDLLATRPSYLTGRVPLADLLADRPVALLAPAPVSASGSASASVPTSVPDAQGHHD